MIYIIIGIFISLLFVLFCCLHNIIDNLYYKTEGKLKAVECKIDSFKDVLKKYNIAPSNKMIKDENYNKLTDIEKKAVVAASNSFFKETINKAKLQEKYEKLYNLRNIDFWLYQIIFGFIGFFLLVVSVISFAVITAEMKGNENKIKVYSDTTNNVRPYEEDVINLICEIRYGKDLAKNHYWTSFRTKKWLELDETPLITIKDTKGFNTIPPRATIKNK